MTASLCHDMSLMQGPWTPRVAATRGPTSFAPIVSARAFGPLGKLRGSQVHEDPEQRIDIGLAIEMKAGRRVVAPSDAHAEQPVRPDGAECVLVGGIVADVDGGGAGEQIHGTPERNALVGAVARQYVDRLGAADDPRIGERLHGTPDGGGGAFAIRCCAIVD